MDDFALGYMAGQDGGSGGGNNGGFWGGDGWWAIIIFAMIFGWGNGGWGGGFGGGGGINTPAGQGYATRADINEGFMFNDLQRGVSAIQSGICDSTYALNNAINAGFNGVNMAICQQGHNISTGFAGVQSQLASCCCDIQRGIDGVNYNMATQSCATQRAIADAARDITDNANANTRQIMDFMVNNQLQALRDENQTLKFAASQSAQNAFITANQEAQTAELIRRLGRDCPIPAYVVPNPNCCYGNPVGVNYGGGGNGCFGCNY